jgi:hypothetical protein
MESKIKEFQKKNQGIGLITCRRQPAKNKIKA